MTKKAIEVLVKKDVKSFGKQGELKKASAGYVRNFLIPHGYADIATPEIKAGYQAQQAQIAKTHAKAKVAAQNLGKQLADKTITMRAKAGQKGKLFGSIGKEDIAHLIKNQYGTEISKNAVQLKTPIKTLGKHKIELLLDQKVKANLTLQVVSEKS